MNSERYTGGRESESTTRETKPAFPRQTARELGTVALSLTETEEAPTATDPASPEPIDRPESIDDSEPTDSLAETERAFALRSIEFAVDSCRSTERRFQRRLARLDEAGERMPREEFERFEDSYAHDWGQVTREVRQAGLNLSEEAALEAPLFHVYNDQKDLNQWSIDVRAADYYHDRRDQLKQAITASDDPDREADLRYLEGFYDHVYDHIEFRYMPRDEVEMVGVRSYENQRLHSHNQLIKYFNHMNALCEKYDTRRFTVRDFWDTSAYEHLPDSERSRLQTEPMRKRYRNDRDIVEEYYARAFPSAVQRFEAKMNRALRMFGNY